MRWFRAALRRLSRERVSHGGIVFVLTVLMVGVAAAISANNLLFLILAAMLSALLISDFISRLSLAGLDLDFVLPEHPSARRHLGGHVFVRNSKRRMPSFSVHLRGSAESVLSPLYFPLIPGNTTLEERVEVWFEKRGLHRENSFQFSTRFPFGFLERRADVTLRREVLVYPCVDAQPGFEELLAHVRGELEMPLLGRGADFYRIRPYEPLESARHVDWKATAHTGELQVREFAREQDRLLEMYLDVNVPPELNEWFERAVDTCAFLAWSVMERGGRLRFRTQNSDVSMPEHGDVHTILKLLALVSPLKSKAPVPSGDETSYQILFSAADARDLASQGWGGACILGPADLPGPGAGARP